MELNLGLQILIGIAVLILVVLAYSGLFHSIHVRVGTPPVSNLVIFYKFSRGPYKNVGSVFDELAKVAPDLRRLGIYYDPPSKVSQEQLRWAGACIAAEGSEEPDQEVVGRLLSAGYQRFDLPKVPNMLKVTFPNKTPLSFYISLFRTYRSLEKYVKKHELHAFPMMELYDNSGYLTYMAPVTHQEDFSVPECESEEK